MYKAHEVQIVIIIDAIGTMTIYNLPASRQHDSMLKKMKCEDQPNSAVKQLKNSL